MKHQMIDIHSHILPELDDGAQSLQQSMDMARLAVESGVRVMVATPHCTDDRRAQVRASVNMLREALHEQDIPLRLLIGMEIFGTEETAWLLRAGRLYTLNNSRYPLIEFDFDTDGEEETRILSEVAEMGFRPVVAHPERYKFIQQDRKLVNKWMKMGCLFQINRGSLFGRFGGGAQETAFELIRRGFASAVASDAHSPYLRTPWMTDTWELLENRYSSAAPQWLLYENPRRILKNQEIMKMEPEWF